MLVVDQIKIPVGEKDISGVIRAKTAKVLGIKEERIIKLQIRKRSIDARKKPDVFYLFSVAVSVKGEERLSLSKKRAVIRRLDEKKYTLPEKRNQFSLRPVVVGFGPAGMFASYILALCGAAPIVLERGKGAPERKKDMEAFFESGRLNPDSNAQFGEGGAGTFSDGKLVTQKNDSLGRNRFVLETFCKFGANEDILIDPKPHIGTDRLVEIVANMRREIESLGGEIRFMSRVERLDISQNAIRGVVLSDGERVDTDKVILCIGHSARDTYEALYLQGISMEPKPFAVGFRVEHPQSLISELQYGRAAASILPPAPYKLVSKGKKTLYSFCMCPGGYVINASSEEGLLCVNGMSESERDSENANSALVLAVDPSKDPRFFDRPDVLRGVEYQRSLERAAFGLADGLIPQQLFGDFISGRKSSSYGRFSSCTKGRASLCSLRGLLSE